MIKQGKNGGNIKKVSVKKYEARSLYLAKLSFRKTIFKHLKTQGILYPCALEKSTSCQALISQEVRGENISKRNKGEYLILQICEEKMWARVRLCINIVCSDETNHAVKKGEREVGFLIDYCVRN